MDLHGLAKLVAPITKVLMERMGDATEERLVEVLDQMRKPAGAAGLGRGWGYSGSDRVDPVGPERET